MNSDKSVSPTSGGSTLLRIAIVTVLGSLCSLPLLLLIMSALPGPIGFVLIITPMIILQWPLVWLLIRFKLLPKVDFGRPCNSAESPNDSSVESMSEASHSDI